MLHGLLWSIQNVVIMQQFTGQSTLWTVINPLNTPTQPLKWDYFCFTDLDTDLVTTDLHKAPPHSISFLKSTGWPYLKRKKIISISVTHSASCSTCSCLPWERTRKTTKHATDVSHAVQVQVLPQHSDASTVRTQKTTSEEGIGLNSHSKAKPRIKSDKGMLGNQYWKQGNAWCKRGHSIVLVFHGEVGVKRDPRPAVLHRLEFGTRCPLHLGYELGLVRLPNHNSAIFICLSGKL